MARPTGFEPVAFGSGGPVGAIIIIIIATENTELRPFQPVCAARRHARPTLTIAARSTFRTAFFA
jgi:hypothetical protein